MAKKILYSLIIILSCAVRSIVNAQSAPPIIGVSNPDSLGASFNEMVLYLRSQVKSTDTGEGGMASKLNVFENIWDKRVVSNDSVGGNMFAKYYRALRLDALARQGSTCAQPNQFSGRWICAGPDSLPTHNVGYTSAIWVSPDTTKLLAATPGGLFRSTNSAKNWKCITDNAPIPIGLINVKHIAVHPTDDHTILLATGNEFLPTTLAFGQRFRYGAGIVWTDDDGLTWRQDSPLPFVNSNEITNEINYVFFSPDGTRLYALAEDAIYCRKYPIGSWQNITPSGNVGVNWHTIKFVPGSSNEMYIAAHSLYANTVSKLYKVQYSSSGHVFTQIALPSVAFGVNNPTNAVSTDYGQLVISVPNTTDIYIAVRGTIPQAALFKGSQSNFSWTLINNALPIYFGGAPGCFGLEVSTQNTNNIYFHNHSAAQSVDGGLTFDQISAYTGDPTHGDVRAVFAHTFDAQSDGMGDRLYYATDGGIMMKTINSSGSQLPQNYTYRVCKNINGKGLASGTFLGIGSSELGGHLLAGSFHNGFSTFEANKSPQWEHAGGGDASGGTFSRIDPNRAFAEDDYFATLTVFKPSLTRRVAVPRDEHAIEEAIPNPLPTWADNDGNALTAQKHMWKYETAIWWIKRPNCTT